MAYSGFKGIGPNGYGASPLKQKKVNRKDGVQVKEVPKVALEEGKKILNKGKALVKKIGKISLSTPEGQKRRADRKALRIKQRETKKANKVKKEKD
jgi:hypothetical protein